MKNACAEVSYKDSVIQIVETPGHVDFAADVARSACQALRRGCAGNFRCQRVQARARTIFQALERMKIPTIFAVQQSKASCGL